MTNPITPPPELIEEWLGLWPQESLLAAAQWGADQELEACCEWLQDPDLNVDTYKLRAARRPKPPSLKEQALEVLERSCFVNPRDAITIRRALEQLDD